MILINTLATIAMQLNLILVFSESAKVSIKLAPKRLILWWRRRVSKCEEAQALTTPIHSWTSITSNWNNKTVMIKVLRRESLKNSSSQLYQHRHLRNKFTSSNQSFQLNRHNNKINIKVMMAKWVKEQMPRSRWPKRMRLQNWDSIKTIIKKNRKKIRQKEEALNEYNLKNEFFWAIFDSAY